MKNNLPPISKSYREKLSGSVFSVLLFFLFYLFLILVAVALVILLGFLAYKIISFKFTFYTALIGLAIFGAGISIFYYLIKFIFLKNDNNNNEAVEITKKGQPQLFQIIEQIVNETGTQTPKKVFISPEVNASVSYNSIFWSMFLPVKKNLTIGLGLINSTTVGELKSILSHEFGHFSQRSMKVGGYVNQAQRIIYDTVYNNKNYEEGLLQTNSFWAWQLMGAIAIGVIRIMQFFLKISSEFLFRNHASLSREMEYHADAIATFITNPQEQSSALLRIDLSHSALQNALQFYADSEGIYKTKNLYENQSDLIKKYAEENNHVIVNGLPVVDIEDISRYDKSKLTIEDVFASHPDTKDRISRIFKNKTKNIPENNKPAKELLNGFEELCEAITRKVFKYSTIKNVGDYISAEKFCTFFAEKYPETKMNKIYNGYYNQHQPILKNLDQLSDLNVEQDITSFFNDEKVAEVYIKNGAQNDFTILQLLIEHPVGIKTFRYDGILYKIKDARSLLPKIKNIHEGIAQRVEENDRKIYTYFYQNADEFQKKNLKKIYQTLNKADAEFEKYLNVLNAFANNLQFVSVTLPVEEIRRQRANLLDKEKDYKEALKEFYLHSAFSKMVSEENKNLFLNYLDADYVYFKQESYKDDELEILFKVYTEFKNELSGGFLKLKKNLLKIQDEVSIKLSSAKTANA